MMERKATHRDYERSERWTLITKINHTNTWWTRNHKTLEDRSPPHQTNRQPLHARLWRTLCAMGVTVAANIFMEHFEHVALAILLHPIWFWRGYMYMHIVYVDNTFWLMQNSTVESAQKTLILREEADNRIPSRMFCWQGMTDYRVQKEDTHRRVPLLHITPPSSSKDWVRR